MQCSKCGANVNEGDSSCSKCGSKQHFVIRDYRKAAAPKVEKVHSSFLRLFSTHARSQKYLIGSALGVLAIIILVALTDHFYYDTTLTRDITGSVSPKQPAPPDRLTKTVLSGTWEGRSDKHRLHISMRLEALTASTFIGRVLFKETHILSELQEGFFNESELSATYPIKIAHSRQTLQGIKGRYDNGNLVMAFPIVATKVESTDYGGGQVGTLYYSHIVQETCVMKKTKGL